MRELSDLEKWRLMGRRDLNLVPRGLVVVSFYPEAAMPISHSERK